METMANAALLCSGRVAGVAPAQGGALVAVAVQGDGLSCYDAESLVRGVAGREARGGAACMVGGCDGRRAAGLAPRPALLQGPRTPSGPMGR